MKERLAGRRAIITGAASGIGHATAELFASHGARVLAVDLPGVACHYSSAAIVPFEADVAANDTPDRLVAAAAEQLGGVDIVFNNAAIERRASFVETGDDDWDRMFAVTLRAGFRIARAFVPHLEQCGAGRIISTSSMAALRALPGQTAYAAAKAGMLALTRAMAFELGPRGITANAILPGPITTGITRTMEPASAAAWTARAPLRRLGVPEDVALVALFFASADSGYVTGQALAVDGGIFIGA
jgi:NAD(P)-dependent dehydrogenase (short-subunit alcohol dehydrogenase family)